MLQKENALDKDGDLGFVVVYHLKFFNINKRVC